MQVYHNCTENAHPPSGSEQPRYRRRRGRRAPPAAGVPKTYTGCLPADRKALPSRQQEHRNAGAGEGAGMITHHGIVCSGLKRMADKMADGEITRKLFEKSTGVALVPGTFNVRLPESITVPAYSGRIERRDHTGEFGDTIYIVSARVEGIDSWLIRHLLVDNWDGAGHRKDVCEFISEVNLRDVLGVTDGDRVDVRF